MGVCSRFLFHQNSVRVYGSVSVDVCGRVVESPFKMHRNAKKCASPHPISPLGVKQIPTLMSRSLLLHYVSD